MRWSRHAAGALVVALAAAQLAAGAATGFDFGPDTSTFPDAFVDSLTDSNFNASLASLPSRIRFVLVEFMAPWCPHCRHFANDMERLGLTFNQNADSPVRVARVDCVHNARLCDAFGVDGFPTLQFGTPEAFMSMGHSTADRISELNVQHSAEAVSWWISKRLQQVGVRFHYKLMPLDALEDAWSRVWRAHLPAITVAATSVDPWDVEMATAMTLYFAFTGADGVSERQDQRTLADFVEILCHYYPEAACRPSFCQLREQTLPLLHTLNASADREAAFRESWTMCGHEWERYKGVEWRGCRGSFPFLRGYTCGLWSLMHSLAMQVDREWATILGAVRSYIHEFFGCIECREHFFKITADVSALRTHRDAQLWLWRVHNDVNLRVRRLERVHHDGDSAFPKQLWPSPAYCADCRHGNLGAPPPSRPQRAGAPASLLERRAALVRVRPSTSALGPLSKPLRNARVRDEAAAVASGGAAPGDDAVEDELGQLMASSWASSAARDPALQNDLVANAMARLAGSIAEDDEAAIRGDRRQELQQGEADAIAHMAAGGLAATEEPGAGLSEKQMKELKAVHMEALRDAEAAFDDAMQGSHSDKIEVLDGSAEIPTAPASTSTAHEASHGRPEDEEEDIFEMDSDDLAEAEAARKWREEHDSSDKVIISEEDLKKMNSAGWNGRFDSESTGESEQSLGATRLAASAAGDDGGSSSSGGSSKEEEEVGAAFAPPPEEEKKEKDERGSGVGEETEGEESESGQESGEDQDATFAPAVEADEPETDSSLLAAMWNYDRVYEFLKLYYTFRT